MIDTELKFKSKLDKEELLRRLSEDWRIEYLEGVIDDEYRSALIIPINRFRQ